MIKPLEYIHLMTYDDLIAARPPDLCQITDKINEIIEYLNNLEDIHPCRVYLKPDTVEELNEENSND